MRFQLALNKTFCTTPSPLIYQRLKHRQRTKISKKMLSASFSSVFQTKLTISELKSKSVFHPNGNWNRTASVGVLNWVSRFYAPNWLNTNFMKRESKIGYHRVWPVIVLIGNPQSKLLHYVQPPIGRVLRFHTPIHSFGITLEIFPFPKTVQVLPNPTPITQSSINPQ